MENYYTAGSGGYTTATFTARQSETTATSGNKEVSMGSNTVRQTGECLQMNPLHAQQPRNFTTVEASEMKSPAESGNDECDFEPVLSCEAESFSERKKGTEQQMGHFVEPPHLKGYSLEDSASSSIAKPHIKKFLLEQTHSNLRKETTSLVRNQDSADKMAEDFLVYSAKQSSLPPRPFRKDGFERHMSGPDKGMGDTSVKLLITEERNDEITRIDKRRGETVEGDKSADLWQEAAAHKENHAEEGPLFLPDEDETRKLNSTPTNPSTTSVAKMASIDNRSSKENEEMLIKRPPISQNFSRSSRGEFMARRRMINEERKLRAGRTKKNEGRATGLATKHSSQKGSPKLMGLAEKTPLPPTRYKEDELISRTPTPCTGTTTMPLASKEYRVGSENVSKTADDSLGINMSTVKPTIPGEDSESILHEKNLIATRYVKVAAARAAHCATGDGKGNLEEVTGPSTLTQLDRRIARSSEEPSNEEKQVAVRAAAARRQRAQERAERKHGKRFGTDPVCSPSSRLVIFDDVEEPPPPPSFVHHEGHTPRQEEGEGLTISTAPDGSPLIGDSMQRPGAYRVGGGVAHSLAGEQDDVTTSTSSITDPYHIQAVLVVETETVEIEPVQVETEPVLEEMETGREEEIREMHSMIRKDRRLLLCIGMTFVVFIVLAAVLGISFLSPKSTSDSPEDSPQQAQPTTPTKITTGTPTSTPTIPPPTMPPPTMPTTTSTPTSPMPTAVPTTSAPTAPMPTAAPTPSPPVNCSTSSCGWLQVGNDVDGSKGGDHLGWSVSFAEDGTRFAAAARHHDRDGKGNIGLVQIYEEKGGNWMQIGSDLLGDSAGDTFGRSVSISGDGKRVAVGAPWYDDTFKGDAGQTKVYEYHLGSWVLLGSPITGEAGGDHSGWSLSLSYDGNIVAIGARYNDGTKGYRTGHVRVYEYVSNVWTKMGDDIDGEADDDETGYSLSLSNDGHTIAIGAQYNDGINGANSGHTRVYKYNGSTWAQHGQDLDGEDDGGRSGYSVSLSADGNIVAVAAPWNDNVNGEDSGHVRVYQYISILGMWSQRGGDIDGEAAGERSGNSVSLSSDGTILAVGSRYNNGVNGVKSGHVQIYRFDGNAWVQVGGDMEGESGADQSGESISLSGDGTRVVIGAPYNDAKGDNSGHVRVYELVATTSHNFNLSTDHMQANFRKRRHKEPAT